ncbi:MAG: hypothetical protein JO316_16475 [Abitibacteriaceae bacterium]|nr:hypothetical protein [Abditibacteriaceae bacterium]
MTLNVDLDHDGTVEHIVVDKSQSRVLSVWHGRTRLWQGVPQNRNPWKLMTADVDGDGKREIILGVYKSTRFIPHPHNCLFVYGWDGKQVYPKWLGSSLGKSFDDFMFANFKGSGMDNLVALETRSDGLKCVVAYSWIGFGFGVDWERGAWHHAKLLAAKPHAIVVEADGQQIILK